MSVLEGDYDDGSATAGDDFATWAKLLLALSAISLAGMVLWAAFAACLIPLMKKMGNDDDTSAGSSPATGKFANAVHTADPEARTVPSSANPALADRVANAPAVSTITRQMSMKPASTVSTARAVAVGMFLVLAFLLQSIFGIIIGIAALKPEKNILAVTVAEGFAWFVFGVAGFQASILFVNFLTFLTFKKAAIIPALVVVLLSCALSILVAIAAFKLGIAYTMLASVARAMRES